MDLWWTVPVIWDGKAEAKAGWSKVRLRYSFYCVHSTYATHGATARYRYLCLVLPWSLNSESFIQHSTLYTTTEESTKGRTKYSSNIVICDYHLTIRMRCRLIILPELCIKLCTTTITVWLQGRGDKVTKLKQVDPEWDIFSVVCVILMQRTA
jgi:hypothetical protein